MIHSRLFAFIRGYLFGGLLVAATAWAAVDGVVWNGTTGREQAGVTITLVKLEQGMMPAGSTRSDAEGKFHFAQNIVGADTRPAPVLLRAEYEGVTYNQMIPPGTRTGDVRLTVYASAKTGSKGPEQHIMLLEPSGQEMIVNESFLFRNKSQPPVTYVNASSGTLQFYLPAGAKGVVQVNATGPGGMPLRETATKTDQPDIYKLTFPIKPGESRIDLTYLVPYQQGMEFTGRTLYPEARTRLAAPIGVTVSGEGLEPLGEEPQTKAAIFGISDGSAFRLTINGEGRLTREQQGEDGQGGQTLEQIPAAVEKQVWWIVTFAAAILGLGFYGLYSASGQQVQPQKPERPRGKKKA
ncbi:MAG: hypothetical protein HY236_11035 [Acidobacteria bacterium]|nr:hypothetical protein [Acidobacteriota bacterium]